MTPNEIIERERRWATPAGVVTFVAAVLFILFAVLSASKIGGGGDAEHLREINKQPGAFLFYTAMQSVGLALLTLPFAYLFSADSARSTAMRRQFIGLVVAGPIFLAVAYVLNGIVLHDAASSFVAKGVLGTGDHANQVARDVVADQSSRGLTLGFLFAGGLAFAVGMAYTCFYAMRTGLLTRFWGSLGMALAVASVLSVQFLQLLLLWTLYLALVILDRTPGGRPPAWSAGKAIPWPTPGERAAESMGHGDDGKVSGEAAKADAEPANPPGPPGERRKRKRRQ